MRIQRAINATFWVLAGGALALAFLFFGEVLVGGRVYYPGDIARIYLPQRVALARSLAEGALPWWTADLGAGYPLVAGGEVGALYPLNWPLYRWLTPERTISLSIVLHYLLTGIGFWVFARRLGRSIMAASIGSVVFTLGGFTIAHLSHLSVLSVIAWLPWMFAFTHGLLSRHGGLNHRSRRIRDFIALGIVVGMQFLGGHPQMALLGLIPLGLYALFLLWRNGGRRGAAKTWPRRAAPWLAAMALGTLLGAPQLVPTLQLSLLSQRAGGLESGFFTSYSFHPFLLATYLSPFVLGNPYPLGTIETMVYVGLLPLALVTSLLDRARRERQISSEVVFWIVLALLGVVLSFGRHNPLYGVLERVPLLNLFRAPARYQYWTGFALAVLSAHGYDALLQRTLKRRVADAGRSARLMAVGLTLASAGVMILAALTPDADGAVALWRGLPLVLAAATVTLMAGLRRLPVRVWSGLALLVLVADLFAYSIVLRHTYSASLPYEQVIRTPDSVAFFEQDRDLYRLYTKEEILPALSVQRESHYPNMAMTHGLNGANVYLPLVPRAYDEYLSDLTPERLNLLNVRYYLIPQLLPVDEASELYDVQNPFSALPVNRWLEIDPVRVTAIEVESYVSHAADLPDGIPAADLLVRDTADRQVRLPLRIGIETAEWAYARDDVGEIVAHSMPPIATTFAARSGFPPREHPGHTYRARFELPAGFDLAAVRLEPAMPEAFVRVERVWLMMEDGQRIPLNHLVGLGDHTLVYRSEDVLVYRNEDALPRAYTVPAEWVNVTGDGLRLPDRLSTDAVGEVQIVRYSDTSVTLEATVDAPSYLILADLHYPGWRATVGSDEAPILRADGLFRAVYLPAGTHRVEFAFRASFGVY